MGDDFRAFKDHKKKVKAKYGLPCPVCQKFRPRTNATILMPQQRCRVDGYQDPRPELSDEEWQNP